MSLHIPCNTERRIIACLIVVATMMSSQVSGVSALFIEEFSNDQSQVDIEFYEGGTDNDTGLLLPTDGTITGTELRVSGNALNVSVDVGEDGDIDWAFEGQGYGRLGHQSVFSDDSGGMSLNLAKDENGSKPLLLPKGINVQEAWLMIEPHGTTNLTWSNDRLFTIPSGDNDVALGFQDSEYVVPAITDLDSDGALDLLVGVQSSDSPSSGELEYYRGLGLSGTPSLLENASFSEVTVSGLRPSPAIIDIDQDADQDLVYGSEDGTLVFYKNEGTVQSPDWTENTTLLAGIDVGGHSSPAFGDLNGDGKLDLVVGNDNGDFVFFNNTGSQGSPQYSLVPNYLDPASVTGYSSPALFDIDGDTDLDLISGNSSGEINMFLNNGTTSAPDMEESSTFFNGIWTFDTMSSPTLADIDGDGDQDLCVGYRNARIVVWLNKMGEGGPAPWEVNGDFLLGNTTTLSSQASAIEMADLDGDGLEDLIEVTDDSVFITHDQVRTDWGVRFNKNISSFNGHQEAASHHSPSFADMDADGDLDMLSGSQDGTLTYFSNEGNAMIPDLQKTSPWAPVSGIDVGQYSTPELGDLDADGLPDLLIGSGDGLVHYYSNTGSSGSPSFSLDTSILSSLDYGAGARTIPELTDIEGDGDLDLILSHRSTIGYSTLPDLYLNTGTPSTPSFTLDTTLVGDTGYILEGQHTGMVDIDLDGDLELVMGGDPLKKLYVLERNTFMNLDVDLNGHILEIDQEQTAPQMALDIDNQVTQAVMEGQGDADEHGNDMVEVFLDLEARTAMAIEVTIDIHYTYGARMNSLVSDLNEYIEDHVGEANQDGMVYVPVSVSSASEGDVRLFGLNITVDRPPVIVGDLQGYSIDEDTSDRSLIDLYEIFQDDFTDDVDLSFGLNTTPSPAVVEIRDGRYISVDAETGPENDDWNGQVTIELNATDALGQVTTAEIFEISVNPVNDPPVIHSTPPTSAKVDTLYTHQMNVTDVDGDDLTYGMALNPQGMMMNSSSGSIRWMPTQSDIGPNEVKLTVSDGDVMVNQSFNIEVAPIPEINHPPEITSEPPTVAYVGLIYKYDVDAIDEDEDTLSYIIPPTIRPEGMMMNYTTGVITWVPDISQIGEHDIEIEVSDGRLNVSQNFTLRVEEINLPPEISTNPVTLASVGVAYEYDIEATDPEDDQLSFELIQGPDGMDVDRTEGLITWMPTGDDVGPVQVTVRVSDGINPVNHSFSVHVSYVQPKVQIRSPKEDQGTVSGTIKIEGTATIGTGEVVKVQVKVDEGDWRDARGTTEWSYRLDTTKLSDGVHIVYVRSMSEHTESEMTSVTIKVDNPEEGGLGDMLLMGALVAVIAVTLVVVFSVLRMRKRASGTGEGATSPTRQVAPVRSTPEEDVPDEEMEADLAEMEREMRGDVEEDIPTDEEMEEELRALERMEDDSAEDLADGVEDDEVEEDVY